jgi:hypothetical protein
VGSSQELSGGMLMQDNNTREKIGKYGAELTALYEGQERIFKKLEEWDARFWDPDKGLVWDIKRNSSFRIVWGKILWLVVGAVIFVLINSFVDLPW